MPPPAAAAEPPAAGLWDDDSDDDRQMGWHTRQGAGLSSRLLQPAVGQQQQVHASWWDSTPELEAAADGDLGWDSQPEAAVSGDEDAAAAGVTHGDTEQQQQQDEAGADADEGAAPSSEEEEELTEADFGASR
jgi:hypothetical protein